jgi:saccharopine dehydrogenase-like NADP-dependent oxidoreductase
MSKKVVVFGAGMVASPLVSYLAGYGFELIVTDIDIGRAEKLVEGFNKVSAKEVDTAHSAEIGKLVNWCDLAVSLLPAPMHPKIAEICIRFKKNMVTASYVSPEMQKLDDKAVKADIIILNEIGVDPGIDHMSAMKIFDEVRDRGGRISSFLSYCGGLPAHEYNTNPLGYKFSWSPKGVLRAASSDAEYLRDGKKVKVEAEDLFTHYWLVDTGRSGWFEAYPNRNSLEYIELYGLSGINTICRGTFRNISHCDTWYALSRLGFFNDNKKISSISCTIREFILTHLLQEGVDSDLKSLIADRLSLDESSVILKKMEWLGFFSNFQLEMENASAMDVLSLIMLDKMSYFPDEKDMLIMHHDIIADFGQKRERITSTLFENGLEAETAMARTVALPAAIASRLILEGRIGMRGVQRPLDRGIYQPVLAELAALGIQLEEKYYPVGEKI